MDVMFHIQSFGLKFMKFLAMLKFQGYCSNHSV